MKSKELYVDFQDRIVLRHRSGVQKNYVEACNSEACSSEACSLCYT